MSPQPTSRMDMPPDDPGLLGLARAIRSLADRPGVEPPRVAATWATALLQAATGRRDALVDRLMSLARNIGRLSPASIDAATAMLLDALRADSPRARRAAAQALRLIGDRLPDDSIPRLIAALDDEDRTVRMSLIAALVQVGDRAFDHVLPLLAGERTATPVLRRAIAALVGELAQHQLGAIVPDAIITALIQAAADSDDWSLSAACEQSLRRLGPRVNTPIEQALSDPDPVVREHAARLAGTLREQQVSDGVIGALIGILDDPHADHRVRGAAAIALGKLGARSGEPGLRALFRLTSQDYPGLRRAAFAALAERRRLVPGAWLAQCPDELLPALVEALGSPSWSESQVAKVALAAQGSPAIAPLVRALRDERPTMRQHAAEVLGELAT